MGRFTRRIVLFGGPGASLSPVGADKKRAVKPSPLPTKPEAPSAAGGAIGGSSSEATKKPSWFRRLWGSKREPES